MLTDKQKYLLMWPLIWTIIISIPLGLAIFYDTYLGVNAKEVFLPRIMYVPGIMISSIISLGEVTDLDLLDATSVIFYAVILFCALHFWARWRKEKRINGLQ
jgi:hypothetical protein